MIDEFAGLTATERRIVEEYLNGHTPKEIAHKLNVSIRTVYKALYKYRKNLKELGFEEKAEMLKVRKRRRRSNTLASPKEQASSKSTDKSIEEAFLRALANVVYGQLFSAPSHRINSPIKVIVDELCTLLRELNQSVSELKNALNKLSNEVALLRECIGEVKEFNLRQSVPFVEETEQPIPSYLLDNPWIEVLKMRGRE